jgi:transcriptional regulator with XRE-family HTH domain
MNQTVDATRLRQIRTLQRLSQDDLAKKAGLNKQTIYRLEMGGRPTRRRTLDCLSRALGVDADVLVGKKPVAIEDRPAQEPPDNNTYQVKAPLDAALRNAYSLVALRYNIPASRIVELAPLLFVLLAEGSLAWRRDKLAELQNVYEKIWQLRPSFPHLPATVTLPRGSSEEGIAAEQASINAKDIFADTIPNDIYWDVPHQEYDESNDNPFVRYLRELASSIGAVAEIESLAPKYFTSYQVCRDEAIRLAGGDESLADGVLNGWALIHKMPPDLIRQEASAQRVEWMRPMIEAALRAQEEFQNMSLDDQLKSLGL